MWPKIIQINRTDVYIISGNRSTPSAHVSRFESNATECYMFNLHTKQVKKLANIPIPRQAFGICHINHQIFVAGGVSNKNYLKSCQIYDTNTDSWSEGPDLPMASFALNLLAVNKRFIFGFGLTNRDIDTMNEQRIVRLDTWASPQTWQIFTIRSELPEIGCQYGFFPLSESRDQCEFLVFGGVQNGGDFELMD